MAVYKTKSFNRWANSSGLKDEALLGAAAEVAEGNVEAKLGGGIFKKRVALAGRGKSGSSRTLLVFKQGEHTFYLHGFNKNDRSNISRRELQALKKAAEVWFSKSRVELETAIEIGVLIELITEEE